MREEQFLDHSLYEKMSFCCFRLSLWAKLSCIFSLLMSSKLKKNHTFFLSVSVTASKQRSCKRCEPEFHWHVWMVTIIFNYSSELRPSFETSLRRKFESDGCETETATQSTEARLIWQWRGSHCHDRILPSMLFHITRLIYAALGAECTIVGS